MELFRQLDNGQTNRQTDLQSYSLSRYRDWKWKSSSQEHVCPRRIQQESRGIFWVKPPELKNLGRILCLDGLQTQIWPPRDPGDDLENGSKQHF